MLSLCPSVRPKDERCIVNQRAGQVIWKSRLSNPDCGLNAQKASKELARVSICKYSFIFVSLLVRGSEQHFSLAGLWERLGQSYISLRLYSSHFQPLCNGTLVCREWSAGVPQEFGGGSQVSRANGGCEPPTGSMVCRKEKG